MSIANDLNDVINVPGDLLAHLAKDLFGGYLLLQIQEQLPQLTLAETFGGSQIRNRAIAERLQTYSPT